MITPQQIEEISFRHATFGGYDVQAVDEVLGPLTEDYVTLYKENSLLKSKMRILVSKLEEYRNSEDTMRDTMLNAQRTCEKMIQETEAKCARMLTEASEMAAENTRNAQAAMAIENARVEETRRVATEKIDRLTKELNTCLQMLNRIRNSSIPGGNNEAIFDYDKEPDEDATAALADEIAHNLENLVGTTDEPVVAAPAVKAEPAASDATSKFAGLSDHFGPDYDPTNKK